MSWLSELFGGGGGEDPNAVAQRQFAQQQELARQAQLAQEQQFAAMMALLKPPEPKIDPRIQQREDLRSGATSALRAALPVGFESQYVPDTLDDALASQVYGEQRGKADAYLQNLLKRGVITDSGAAAGTKNLDEQGARVRTQLKDLGDQLLTSQRGKLQSIYGQGADAASTVDIGQTFDPNAYAKMIQDNVGDFTKNFGDSFRAGIPGDLFDTSGLSSIAGGAQGAGNLAFDPNAVSGGVIGEPTDETESDKTSTLKKRTTSVF